MVRNERCKRTAQVVKRLLLLLRLAHRWTPSAGLISAPMEPSLVRCAFFGYMKLEEYWRDVPIEPPMVQRCLQDQTANPRTNYFLAAACTVGDRHRRGNLTR